jgi:hypothetical protein
MHAISFLIVALCIFKFNVSLVTARPLERGSRLVAILEGLNTNAKRFAAGLPPLPPVRRLVGSKVDTARRQTPSFIPQVGKIEVRDASGKSLGWLGKKLDNGHFTLTNGNGNADIFTANLGITGTTYPVNFKESTTDKYLAGLLSPGTTLTPTSGFATLGLSSQVPFGAPQVNNPSIDDDPSETAIWLYDSSTKSVTAIWINQSSPRSIPLFIWHDSDNKKDAFYLTGSSNPPTTTSNIVTFYSTLVKNT